MRQKLLGYCLALIVSMSAQADAHYRCERSAIDITIEKDATYTLQEEVTLQLIDETGVQQQGQQPFFYNAQFDTLTIIEAYTLKANGQKIPIDREKAVFDQPLPVAADAPMYTQARQISIIFPNLAAGDRIVYKVRWHQHTPLFPDAVAVYIRYPQQVIYDHATLSMTIPNKLPLFFDVAGLTEKPTQQHATTTTRRWYFSRAKKIEPEQRVANLLTNEPHVFVTRFPDYHAAANAYEARATDKHTVTPEIQALADQLTKGLAGTEAKARAIYKWVAQNIRYVAVYFGAGGVVPHPAADVLAHRYGDCKDHATLLQTLLKAAGIESSTALVYQGYQYLPQKVATLQAFNHAITYIPELDRFVDSTLETAPFGVLSAAESQSPALITRSGEIRFTPAYNHDNAKVQYQNNVTYQPTGHAHTKITAQYHGGASIYTRYFTRQETPKRLLADIMRQYGLHGTGQLNPGQPNDLAQDHVVTLTLELDDQLLVPGPAGLSIPSAYGFYAFSDFPNFILTEKEDRHNAFVCTTTPLRAEYQLTLPNNVDILAIPRDIALNEHGVHYHATYRQVENTVFVSRGFTFTPAQNFCPANMINTLKPVMRKIIKDLKSQIVYRARDQDAGYRIQDSVKTPVSRRA